MLSGLPGPSLIPPPASRILLPPSLRDLLPPFPHPQPWLGFYSPTHTCYKLKCPDNAQLPSTDCMPGSGPSTCHASLHGLLTATRGEGITIVTEMKAEAQRSKVTPQEESAPGSPAVTPNLRSQPHYSHRCTSIRIGAVFKHHLTVVSLIFFFTLNLFIFNSNKGT